MGTAVKCAGNIQEMAKSQVPTSVLVEKVRRDIDDDTDDDHNDHDQPERHDAATRLALAVTTNDGNRICHAVKFARKDFVERLAPERQVNDGVSIGGAGIFSQQPRLGCAGSQLNRASDGWGLDRGQERACRRLTHGRAKEAFAVVVTQRLCRVITGSFVCDHDSIVTYLSAVCVPLNGTGALSPTASG